MSTIVYRNAKLVVDGVDISADLYELTVEYAAEMLDETAFGDDTRIRKGGLFTARIAGAGWAQFGATDVFGTMMFENVGDDDAALAAFPNGITVGQEDGFAMKGVLAEFTLGETVGNLLRISFAFEGRGV